MATNMDECKDKKINNDADVNILLLGETGVGKSTFINAFVNYLTHKTLAKARSSGLTCLIPCKFTIPDENYESRIVAFGSNDNEDTEIEDEDSSTQAVESYLFPCDDFHCIRLIDTPGIGDARGLDQNEVNFEYILSYISQFEYLNAICFLLEPNMSAISAYFKFCIMHLLTNLEKSVVNNFIFIFTNSRSTFYRPGDTLPILQKILNGIEESTNVKIPLSKSNIFCVDNEAFKFLITLKQYAEFSSEAIKEFSVSWETSYITSNKLLKYICGDATNKRLHPHNVQNTISINEARRNILNLSKPLADIVSLIQDNITVLKRHQAVITDEKLSQEQLVAQLYIPTVDLVVNAIAKPITVCGASKCSEKYKCAEIIKYHYKQRCHDPCELQNVPQELIGTPELRRCWAMENGKCRICGCDFSAHMHIYYETEVVQTTFEDFAIRARIKNNDDAIKEKCLLVKKMQVKCDEFEKEKEEISGYMAMFAAFLQEYSIADFNDSYLAYLDYLIDSEQSLGPQRDSDQIIHFYSLKECYEQQQKKLNETIVKERQIDEYAVIISPLDIMNFVTNLYALPHMGQNILQLHELQAKSVQKSILCSEYRHQKLITDSKSINQRYIPGVINEIDFKNWTLPNFDNIETSMDASELSIRKAKQTSVKTTTSNIKISIANWKAKKTSIDLTEPKSKYISELIEASETTCVASLELPEIKNIERAEEITELSKYDAKETSPETKNIGEAIEETSICEAKETFSETKNIDKPIEVTLLSKMKAKIVILTKLLGYRK